MDTNLATTDDQATIQQLYQRILDGWNRGDGHAFAAPFAEECDFIAFDGIHFTGRAEIAESHQLLFDRWMRGTRLVGQVERVRFLGPDAAILYAVGGTILRNQTRPAPERDSLQTLVAQRQGGEWRLVAFHNTRLRPIGRNGASFLIWAISDRLWRLCRLNPPMAYR